MKHPIHSWALCWVRLRAYLLLLAVVITACMGYFATHLTFDFSPDNIFLKGDPAREFYTKRFIPEFGMRSKVCLVAVQGDIHSRVVQKALYQLHHALSKEPELGHVRSLVNTDIFKQKEGVLQVQSLFNERGEAEGELLEWALQDPLIADLMVGKKGQGAAIVLQLPVKEGDAVHSDALVHQLQKMVASVAREFPQLTFDVTGLPVTMEATISMLKKDQLVFIPLVMLMMAILLFMSFRNIRGVVLPFLATGMAAIWAIGWLVLQGHPINMVNNSLVVLLLVIGVADAIHVIARYNFELAHMRKTGLPIDRDELVARTVQYMLLPVTLTTVTAAIGFAASGVAEVGIIRSFGIDAAVGVMGSLFTTMLIVPGILRYLPLPKESTVPHGRFSMEKLLGHLGYFAVRHAKLIVLFSLILFAVFVGVAKDLRPHQTFVGELPTDAPAIRSLRQVEKSFGGVLPFEVVFEAKASAYEEPATLRRLAEVAEFIKKQSVPLKVIAFTDVLRSFERSLTDGKDVSPVSSWSDDKVAQLLMLFELSDPKMLQAVKQDFFSADGKLFRMQVLGKDADTHTYMELRENIEKELKAHPIPGLTPYVTGATMISSKALNYVMFDLVRALSLGIAAIFILMALQFRSIKFGLIGLLPNLLPIALMGAFMQVFHISFRVATVIIFTMAIGIAVDTSIHLLTRFQQEVRLYHLRDDFLHLEPVKAILLRTLCSSGRPVVYAMLILFAGFSVMGFSHFVAIKDFGLLSGVTLGSSLLIDLLLVPALVVWLKPKI